MRHHAGAESLGVNQLKVQPVAIGKEALALVPDNRKYHQPIFIDEIVLPQCLDELTAAGNQNVEASLLLELGNFLGDVDSDNG